MYRSVFYNSSLSQNYPFWDKLNYPLQEEEISRGIKMGQPEKKFNVGVVKATIWKNTSKDGNA
jgi:hypothetical protein